MNLNKAVLIGRLTRDPELKDLPSGSSVCTFSIATSETYTKDGQKVEKAEFHNIVVYGKMAESAGQYLKKGQLVMVEGKITTRSWDKQDGSKVYRTEIIAHAVQFGPKNAQNGAPRDEREEPNGDTKTQENIEPIPKNTKNSPIKVDGSDGIDYPEEDIDPKDIPF